MSSFCHRAGNPRLRPRRLVRTRRHAVGRTVEPAALAIAHVHLWKVLAWPVLSMARVILVYCHACVRHTPLHFNTSSSMLEAHVVHLNSIDVVGGVLPHTVRRAKSRAWPGVMPKQAPMARHGRCPSISASSIAVMPWQDVRSVDDHALTARLFLMCEDPLVLSTLRGSAGTHHRGRAFRRTRRHI